MMPDYVCYCFKHTQVAIEEDARCHGRSTIMEQITSDSKAGNCNCAKNNPAGK